MKKVLAIIVVTAVLVGGAAFYGGMTYSKSLQANIFQGQRNLQGQNSGQTGRGPMGGNGQGGARMNMLGNLTIGEIMSIDDKGLTVKIPEGGSKIVLFGSDLIIDKQVEAAKSDLTVGKNISIGGTTNADGSVTAKTIQIRPAVTLPTSNGEPASTTKAQ